MAIVWKLDQSGGFLCGDTESRLTSYAYPTSVHACAAKRKPEAVAREMIAGEWASLRVLPDIKAYDLRHWKELEAATCQALNCS